MALTAHKTVAMFMRYAHIEDDPMREAAELVAKPPNGGDGQTNPRRRRRLRLVNK